MNAVTNEGASFAELNPAQRRAVEFGLESSGPPPPLLIAAGAGTGKTKTLAHRVARLVLGGADARRILLLTFTRRAAQEMTRRAEAVVRGTSTNSGARPGVDAGFLPWAGTFHAIGNRLLRLHAADLGLDLAFTVLDRADAADPMDVVRGELGLVGTKSRFPKKGTCLSIYSYTVNANRPLEETLKNGFPWCAEWEAQLKRLFAAYVETKQHDSVLDYDDLLLYWREALAVPAAAAAMRARFDHIMVDEYQDTNRLQAEILMGLAPDGAGLTVVGDDAQAIYGFRAATVRNILDFPSSFSPPATIIALEQNYRSTQPILDAANAVIARAGEGFAKTLTSNRASAELPGLVLVEDPAAQAGYIADQVLDRREAGIDLRQQAVLFRASHHSALLEIELSRHNIPFVKYGGLKFIEAAHIKDVLGILRWAENPRDPIASFRTLQLLPGIGPATARKAIKQVSGAGGSIAALDDFEPPAAAVFIWPGLCQLLQRLRQPATDWVGQIGQVRRWYEPLLERLYDYPTARIGDLDQLEQIAANYTSRERFLSELTLDPPEKTSRGAGTPTLDEDYLILSTIHSAKGQEWDAVYLLNVVDGCIPSDMATGKPEQIDEERRLLYVAMTRARQHLELIQPMRFFSTHQPRFGGNHVLAPRSRFLPDEILHFFDRHSVTATIEVEAAASVLSIAVNVGARMRQMWT